MQTFRKFRLFWEVTYFSVRDFFFLPKSFPKHHFNFCLREWISCIFPHSQISPLPAKSYGLSLLSGYQTMEEYTKCSFSFPIYLWSAGRDILAVCKSRILFCLKKKKKILTEAWFPSNQQSFPVLCVPQFLLGILLMGWYSWHNPCSELGFWLYLHCIFRDKIAYRENEK